MGKIHRGAVLGKLPEIFVKKKYLFRPSREENRAASI
jgi:hypothetical protein